MHPGKKQNSRAMPARSGFEFRVGGDFSPVVLFGGSHDKHLQVLIGLGGFSSVTVNARTQKVPGRRRVEKSLWKLCSQQAARAGSHQRSGAGSRVRE